HHHHHHSSGLEVLFQGPQNISNLLDQIFQHDEQGAYRTLFKEVVRKKDTNRKLTGIKETSASEREPYSIDETDPEKLKKIFLRLYISPPKLYISRNDRISKEHIKQILEAYGLQEAAPEEQSYALLAISALFCKYSSSGIFGTEENSPPELRRYACSLLSEVGDMRLEGVSQNEIVDYQNRLRGAKNAFTCTAVLFSTIQKKLQLLHKDQKNLKKIYDQIIPLVWQ
uniref:E3 ubiquitin-protein ligase SopA-like catalytic domain-containing protein n=1 Tax=Verrucomicrobiota TaxID=74201 RepID=UPI0025C74188|nr:Chain A, E3 ubiquitin-protein ligase SopA-like catalytic domain-containing protein [Verrucomicrobiota]8ST7_C Chain C, E3 ubiquitin-protein ligase SopA-like catalytic domain-containing protein [Verrucomicrobiota]